VRQTARHAGGKRDVAENMVNQRFAERLGFLRRHLISLLNPFFSNYSTNIKRFA
jgi:hypothetical protein